MAQDHYDHNQVETHWQQLWEKTRLFLGTEKKGKELTQKQYLLFAFAYPSGSGLHVGHVESKTALDIVARYSRMQGMDVFFPVGWDAFGLPAENYAIKTGTPPAETTKNAIDTFRRQIKRLGISYDWDNEIATSHPEYYKWTQWIFLQLFNKGLAYQKDGKVNWCPSCQTVLANEQVVEGLCERCDTEVIQKDMRQWYFKITEYQEELITGLDSVDWPEPTKQQQLHWIGKKTGIEIKYQVEGLDTSLACFTTRPDTNFGATFVVIAPEHPFALSVAKEKSEVAAYLEQAQKKTELERQQEGKKKSGVFTGYFATNQLTGKKMPIWVSDFVLGSFGTGAVVGVPAHDVRDFQFAQFVNAQYPDKAIEIIRVVTGEDGDVSEITSEDQVQEEQGTMINSDFLNGMEIGDAVEKMMDHLEEKGYGKRVTTYRLRDWLISRQRYWGTPIPVVYDPEGNPHPVKEEHLPWTLPTDVDFKPTGESPLKSSKEFIARTEKLYGKGWRPEFDTMDTFVDSSWYFMRYADSRNQNQLADPEQLNKWLPIDLYMIGPEHIVLHLLYSRFFTKFMRDQGYCNADEPFAKMRHQGMILGPDGKKMSKSKGNVINPDEVIEKFGADTLRVYEMFMGPLEADKPWDVRAVIGVYKFLQRIYRLMSADVGEKGPSDELERSLHQTIKKVSEDIPKLKFNTAIAQLMKCSNTWEAASREGYTLSRDQKVLFSRLIAPFSPFLAEELYHQLTDASEDESVHVTSWPTFDEALAKEDTVTIPVQVNGKVRAELYIAADKLGEKDQILELARKAEDVQKYLEGKTVRKEIYVPGRIVNLVV